MGYFRLGGGAGEPEGNPGAVGKGAPVVPPLGPEARGPLAVACAGASRLCHGFGLRWFGSSLAWCVPVPRFRWLVCGSSLAGCLPVAREGFDFDLDLDFELDLDFDLPSAPLLISPSGCGGEIRSGADGSARRVDAGRRGAERIAGPHSTRTLCRGSVQALCGRCAGYPVSAGRQAGDECPGGCCWFWPGLGPDGLGSVGTKGYHAAGAGGLARLYHRDWAASPNAT